MGDLSEAKLLADFDQLVDEGVIVYGPHEVVEVACDGYPVSLCLINLVTNHMLHP